MLVVWCWTGSDVMTAEAIVHSNKQDDDICSAEPPDGLTMVYSMLSVPSDPGGFTDSSAFSKSSLRCIPGAHENGNLTVVLHPELQEISFSGITPVFSAQSNHKLALIVFQQAANLTLQDSSLLDISTAGLSSLVTFSNSTDITISNLTSYGCTADHILSSWSTDTKTNSHFQVQSSAFSNSSSGAFHVVWQHLTIMNTTFDNFEASPADSLLHHNNTDGSFLAIDNCTFFNVHSLANNLSVVVDIARPNILMNNTQFIACTASFAVVNIRRLPLFNGSYLANETATIDGCTFANCSASQGALYMLGENSMPTQQMNLYHSKFVGNQGFYGGAVTLFAVGTVQVFDCLFQDNYAMWGLSAFYIYGWVQQVTYFTMRDSVFVGNNGTRSALADPGQTGITDTAECGGLYLSSCNCVGIANSTFDRNTGIGLCVHGQLGSSPDCSSSDAVFFNQSTVAGPSDEAFLNHLMGRYDHLVITVDIRDSDFSDNTDAFLTRTTAEPDEVQPVDYLTGGAGLDIQEVLFAVLSSNTFRGNQGRQGSALHLDTCFASYIWNSTFDNNTATGQGGALAVVNTHSGKGLLIANSILSNNEALFGGALYADVGADVTLSNSQVIGNHAVTDGGAVFCDNCQQLHLELQTDMRSNTAEGGGGAVYCDACILLTVNAIMMTGNSAGANGGALVISGNGYTLSNISESTFASNTAAQTESTPSTEGAADGGAVSISGGASLVSHNRFWNNSAAGHGGAVAYEDDCFTVYDTTEALYFLWSQLAPAMAALAGNCSYFISTANNFSGNHADVAGAVIYSSNVSSMQLLCSADLDTQDPSTDCPEWLTSSFPANTVGAEGIMGYGPGLAFPPAVVTFSETFNNSKKISYISNGSTKVPVPIVNVLDQAGNKVKAQPLIVNVTVQTVSTTANGMSWPQLPGQTEAAGDVNGDIAVSDLVLIAAPGEYDLLIALPHFPQVPAAVLHLIVQPCGVGQIPSADHDQCMLCPSSTYSFTPLVDDCKPCPAQAKCTGGATLVPLQQWHSAPDSDHIVPCPNNNACAGSTSALLACQNEAYQARLNVEQAFPSADPECTLDDPWISSDPDSYMRQLCAPGYYGPVCSLCVKTGNVTYGRVGSLECKPCRRTVTIIAAYVASALLVLAWLTYTIHVTLVENEEAAAGHVDPPRTSQLIRALNLWLQYTTLLGGINIPAPKSVHWVFNAAQFAFATVTSGSLSTDCLLTGRMNAALQRILISLAVPVIMFIVLVGVQVLRWHKGNQRCVSPLTSTAGHQSSSSAELRRRLLITLLEVLFYYFPSLLTSTLSLFACYHIDPSGPANAQYHNAQADWHNGYWLPDMTVQCFTGWHKRLAIILGTPLMALTWSVIPLLPAALLFLHRGNLNAPRIQLQLGYIYRVYRPELWFWDSVVLLLTLALAASQVFATALDTYFQLTIMLMILMVGVTAFAHFQPFTDDLLQRMQVLGLFIVQTTAAGCLYFLDPTNVANSSGLEAVGITLLVLNVAYVVVMLIMIAVFGAHTTKHFTRAAFALMRTSSTQLKHAVSGLSNSGAGVSASRNLVTISSMQSQKRFHVSDIDL
ncbi:TPA: hypothetical protein ACH3X1_003408 [Trebouxia sp. C0004]